jgi:hypothetical protein
MIKIAVFKNRLYVSNSLHREITEKANALKHKIIETGNKLSQIVVDSKKSVEQGLYEFAEFLKDKFKKSDVNPIIRTLAYHIKLKQSVQKMWIVDKTNSRNYPLEFCRPSIACNTSNLVDGLYPYFDILEFQGENDLRMNLAKEFIGEGFKSFQRRLLEIIEKNAQAVKNMSEALALCIDELSQFLNDTVGEQNDDDEKYSLIVKFNIPDELSNPVEVSVVQPFVLSDFLKKKQNTTVPSDTQSGNEIYLNTGVTLKRLYVDFLR